jgi:hypothetical protein
MLRSVLCEELAATIIYNGLTFNNLVQLKGPPHDENFRKIISEFEYLDGTEGKGDGNRRILRDITRQYPPFSQMAFLRMK